MRQNYVLQTSFVHNLSDADAIEPRNKQLCQWSMNSINKDKKVIKESYQVSDNMNLVNSNVQIVTSDRNLNYYDTKPIENPDHYASGTTNV